MQATLRQIAAATALVAIGTAQAASVTVPAGSVYQGVVLNGTGSLSFSTDLLGALDTGKISVSGYGAAIPTVTKDSDGYYVEASVSAPITSLTLESTSGTVLSATTTGGATQIAPVLKSVSSGGSLTVTDLSVDLANKAVYATLIGGNGVGTLTNVHLWDIGSITGSTSVTGPGTFTTNITGLAITPEGFNDFVKSLGLLTLGKSALAGVADFGTITSTISYGQLDDGPIPQFPEPSSYALMGLGLVGIIFAARRHHAA